MKPDLELTATKSNPCLKKHPFTQDGVALKPRRGGARGEGALQSGDEPVMRCYKAENFANQGDLPCFCGALQSWWQRLRARHFPFVFGSQGIVGKSLQPMIAMKTLFQIVCHAIPRRHLVRASLCALLVLPAAAQTSTTNTITGSISVPGERDVYTFSLTNRARYYFDSLTNVSTLNWSLDGPTGSVVTRRSFTSSDGSSAGTVGVALNPGYYQLTVDCDNSNTNSYAFRFVELTAAALVTTGTVISNSLSPGKETDLYQFTSAAGDRLLFDRLTVDAGLSVWWRLLDPYGNEVFSTPFNDVSSITQRVAGTYTLLLEGAVANADPGFYSFNIVLQGNTPPAPFTGTPITIGSIVSGTLTNAATNFFTFSLATNKVLVFDNLTNSPGTTAFVEGPPGLVVNGTGLNNTDGQNGAPLLELAPGEYQVRIRRTAAGTEFYRFRLLDTEPATATTPGVAIQDSLSPSSETKLYRFDATAGTRFFFATESTNGPSSAEWRLFNPYGERVTQASLRADRGPLTLPISGTYTLLIEGWFGDDPGNAGFHFNVVPVVDGVQALTLGALTSGTIATPGGMQQYLFTLAAPAMLYFDSRTNNTFQLRWSLDGPTGNVVNNRAFSSSDASGGFAGLNLPAGDYTVTVTGSTDNTGSFAFRLFDLAGSLARRC